MINKKEFRGNCGYCNNLKDNLRVCKLRCNTKANWQKKINICSHCRIYLRGLFKYD